jgi:transposase
VRAAGLDPVVADSGETTRRGHLAKHGSPELRWALVQAAHQARYGRRPDCVLYGNIKARRKAAQPAVLTVARKIVRRSYHLLHELERQAA